MIDINAIERTKICYECKKDMKNYLNIKYTYVVKKINKPAVYTYKYTFMSIYKCKNMLVESNLLFQISNWNWVK